MSHFNTIVFSHTPEEVDSLLEPFCESVEAGSPYAVFEEDEEGNMDEQTSKKGFWHNPNATWDWYEWAGRWRGLLKLKANAQGESAPLGKYDDPARNRPGYCDRAPASSLDFSRDEMAYRKSLRRWEVLVEGATPTDEEKETFFFAFKPEYYINRYGSKEFFAEYESSSIPYAFVTADGEWHSCGRMGWFGCDDSSLESIQQYHKEFIAYLEEACKQGLYASMMDLHI